MKGLSGHGVLDVAFAGSGNIPRGRFVKVVTNDTVALAGAGEPAVGVSLEAHDPTKGDEGVLVRLYGVAEVVAGGAVPAGSPVAADAQGRAVTPGTGANVVGVALTAAPAAGHTIKVLLK